MSIVTGDDPLIQQLITLLNIPKNTVGFTIKARINEVVKVECEYYPDISIDPDEIITGKFELHRIEEK